MLGISGDAHEIWNVAKNYFTENRYFSYVMYKGYISMFQYIMLYQLERFFHVEEFLFVKCWYVSYIFTTITIFIP